MYKQLNSLITIKQTTHIQTPTRKYRTWDIGSSCEVVNVLFIYQTDRSDIL